jgi:hypothetical protein
MEIHGGAENMPEWLYIVETSVDPEIEPAWNRWYDEVHVPEMLGCPGWLWGERYVRDGDGGRTYVTVYGLSGPRALEGPAFEAARGWGTFADRLRYTAHLYHRASLAKAGAE